MRMIFTTGQVAKICHVAHRTVANWFDSGKLRGYRLPESLDRRIPRDNLIRFLKERGMPLGELEAEAIVNILLVGTNGQVRSSLKEILPPDEFKIESGATVFETGIQPELPHPDCVVVDFSIGRDEATRLAQDLKNNHDFAGTVRIGLLSDEDNASGFDRTLFAEVFRKPFAIALLAERIQTLVGKVTT